MKPFAPQRAAFVCRSCRQAERRPALPVSSLAARPAPSHTRPITSSPARRPRIHASSAPASLDSLPCRRWAATAPPTESTGTPAPAPAESLPDLDARLRFLADLVLAHDTVAEDKTVGAVLYEYLKVAKALLPKKGDPAPAQHTPAPAPDNGPTSALLSSVKKGSNGATVTKAQVLDTVSLKATEILRHGGVFISPDFLRAYVELQTLLGRPESFPAVFHLYRHKPVPRPNSNPVAYTTPNPDKPSAAIAPEVADMAIDAAVARKDMPLALEIIEETYCTTAHKRSKFLRTALLPLAGLLLTPPAAYTLATRFSAFQSTMDPALATKVATAGILTYTSAVATVGYVALTTSNDQMVRVTWATGMPLWERWVREEERGAFDKIAQAWGFADPSKWGEEEGDVWEGLKEFTGLRGMVVDRVELMDGME